MNILSWYPWWYILYHYNEYIITISMMILLYIIILSVYHYRYLSLFISLTIYWWWVRSGAWDEIEASVQCLRRGLGILLDEMETALAKYPPLGPGDPGTRKEPAWSYHLVMGPQMWMYMFSNNHLIIGVPNFDPCPYTIWLWLTVRHGIDDPFIDDFPS